MIFSLTLFSVLSISAPIQTGGKTIERIEARVGSQIILTSELQEAIDLARKTHAHISDSQRVRGIAFDSLIEKALVREYLAKVGMGVEEQEVERQINSMRTAQGLQNYEELKKALALQGTSLDRLRQDLRTQLEMQSFGAALRRDNLQSIQESEIKNYYQQNKNRFNKNFELSVQECTIAGDEPNAEGIAKKYVEAPGSFDECVQKFSRSPSAPRGGKLGTVTRGLLREEVEAPLFATPAGKVVAIQLPGGIQLLKVLSKKNLGPQTFDQAREEISEILTSEKLLRAKERTLSELRALTLIKIES